MKSKLKKITVVMTVIACIPLLAQAAPLIDSKNIDKQIDNKNTGTVTIMNCSPYPLCAKEVTEEQTKKTQGKTKKKTK
ncbi:hypothetical protein KO527_21430 [Pseudoalteromonas sp. C2R02]|uniref:hypothetical protein n=1 Tax=Pseudoalteromonas sp. C2R02 TaxID=2841565 RepID=UPI001C08FECF|nr:hypothetical protein [Pseudoalteromonas sp. C2R02]MBU2971909.1 hypothetical protein [Pseudoalteromonas sp. C2R02]